MVPALRAAERPNTEEREAIRTLAEAYLREQSTPGLSIAFAKDGELVYAEGFGLTDEQGDRVEPRHLFRIASVSKPITSTAIFTLIVQGKLALRDKVFGQGSIFGEEFRTAALSSLRRGRPAGPPPDSHRGWLAERRQRSDVPA